MSPGNLAGDEIEFLEPGERRGNVAVRGLGIDIVLLQYSAAVWLSMIYCGLSLWQTDPHGS